VFATHVCREPSQYDSLVSQAFLDRHAPEVFELGDLSDAIERLVRGTGGS